MHALLATAKLGGQDVEEVVARLGLKYMDLIHQHGE